MTLSLVAMPDTVARGNVGAGADKQVVERQEPLPVLQSRFGESDRPHERLAAECPLEIRAQVAGMKRQENAVEAVRVRIDSDDWLSANVFCGVRYQPVRAKRNDQVAFRKDVTGNQCAVHHLNLEPGLDRAPDHLEGLLVGIMLSHIS